MRPLTKDQARSPKREADPIVLPEYSAPLLVAKPSASLAVRLRETKASLLSEESIAAMVADMLVDESGAHLFSPDAVPAFLEGISMDSLTLIVSKCAEMYAGKGGAPVPPKPSTSA